MKKIQEVLKNKSGQGVPMILAVVLCCLILACVTFEYMRLMIVAQGVRDSVQSAIVDVATENWDEAYAGLREGYSGGYQLAGSSWSQNVTSGNVYARLQDVLGIEYEGGQYVKYSGENLEYRLYDLHLDVENAPLAPSVPDGITQLNVTEVFKGNINEDYPINITEEYYTLSGKGNEVYTQGNYMPAQESGEYIFFLKAYDSTSPYAGMYFPVDLEYGKYSVDLAETFTTPANASAAEYEVIALDEKYVEFTTRVIEDYLQN